MQSTVSGYPFLNQNQGIQLDGSKRKPEESVLSYNVLKPLPVPVAEGLCKPDDSESGMLGL